MSEQGSHTRFEELEAGRILGDLSTEEMKEWRDLSDAHGFGPDLSLELTAAAIETEFFESQSETIPANVAENLRKSLPQFTPTPQTTSNIVVTPIWKRAFQAPNIGWGIAAVFAALLVISFIAKGPRTDSPPAASVELTPQEARDQLLSKAGDLVETEFGGTDSYNRMSGKVVWSDDLQEGYMTLTDLPANDPSKNQYQLWIVDPARDEKPVDGGVFDIPDGESTAVVPIRNPLLVNKPQAFVITLEQPGGVVVSKQEVVVAIASAS
jgi:hypothetical protein